MTSADSSPLFSAWILPLEVTFATISSLVTLAARTRTSLPFWRWQAAQPPRDDGPGNDDQDDSLLLPGHARRGCPPPA